MVCGGQPRSPPRRCLEQCLQRLPEISWEARCFPALLGNTDHTHLLSSRQSSCNCDEQNSHFRDKLRLVEGPEEERGTINSYNNNNPALFLSARALRGACTLPCVRRLGGYDHPC